MSRIEIVYKTTNPTTLDAQPNTPNKKENKNTPRGAGPLPVKEKNRFVS